MMRAQSSIGYSENLEISGQIANGTETITLEAYTVEILNP